MPAEVKYIRANGRQLADLSQEELIMELRQCHEMFRRCLSLLDGEDAEPVELFTCDELGDSDDMELYYRCKEIYEGK